MDINQVKKQLSRVGLQDRETQIEMIQAAHKAITSQEILCVEAPTGTGKTLSYSVAGYLTRKKKQTLIISTSTIALQEQLIKKDLPLLSRMLGESLNFALAKGRRRYVCHNRLLNPNWTKDIFETTSDDAFDELRSQLENRQWNGDRDELDISVDEQSWRKISTDANGCSGKLCEFHEECAFFSARKRLHQADIIVTNHSLLLSDLELGGGAILPEPEKSIYIIDECHHLPEKALSHFAKSDTLMGSVEWINSLTKTLTNAIKADHISEEKQKNLNTLTHSLIETLKTMRMNVELNEAKFKDGVWRIKEIPDEMLDLAKSIVNFSSSVLAQCELIHATLEEKLKGLATEEKSALEKNISSLGFSSGRARNLFETWSLFCHKRETKEAPVARWFEKRGDAYFCHASPINVSKRLTTLFWEKAKNGVVLCSATIRALGKFDDFRRKTGLADVSNCVEKSIASCFEYQNSLLYIPNMKHEPSGMNQNAHREEAIELLPKLMLPKSGTLVLFTSRYAMKESYEAMPANCSKDILMQTQHNKNKLIEKHKNRIRQGKRSVIFGLASFGEGLDLPADFCQHVIIHKLPFAVPSTPIELTRNEWLTSNKLNPFMISSLPNASIRLTQYVGRLIRQESDIGIVTILDKRIYTKQYGSFLLKNLPDFQQLINKDFDALKGHATTQALWE